MGIRQKAGAVRSRLSPTRTASTNINAGTVFPVEASIPEPPDHLKLMVGAIEGFRDIPLHAMGRMNMAGLRPDHDVLDIGSGVGRTARFLADFLEPNARYEGFDIIKPLVNWCDENITPVFPNFTFRCTPLANTAYSSNLDLPDAASFTFPYPDDSFDFAFAHSVFTHLLPHSAERYVHEAARVLRPGGILFTTWFLFGADYAHDQVSDMTIDVSGDFAILDPHVPETAVGFNESVVMAFHGVSGLDVTGMHPGYRSVQDAVVAIKS